MQDWFLKEVETRDFIPVREVREKYYAVYGHSKRSKDFQKFSEKFKGKLNISIKDTDRTKFPPISKWFIIKTEE